MDTETMKLEEKVVQFKEHQKKMRAYEHALGLMQYDAATGMPSGASDTLSDTMQHQTDNI